LAKGLRQRGWRVTVVALSGKGGDALAELTAAGIGFLTLQMRKGIADPRGWIRFNGWLRRESPDVVHAHLPHATWLARWSRLAVPVRVFVDTLHSCSTGTAVRRVGYRLSGWLGDRVTAVSQAAAAAHLAGGMVEEAKLTVLPNSVNVELWRPDAQARSIIRRELGLNEEFLWLAAGRLEPVKDYPTLLAALVSVPEPAKLLIAGSGILQHELSRLSVQLGLERRVRFLGFQPNLLRWMRAADGFVLSSRCEGLPMGLIEAAACALSAVATDGPGTSEVLIDGRTGYLTPVGDSQLLAESMTKLMQTPAEKRRAMSDLARQLAVERFSLEAILDQWEMLYSTLLERSSKPVRWPRAN
jgi:glycosyltransferase involved in cell wall biosynthesis